MTDYYPCASKPAGLVNTASNLADAGRTSRIRYRAAFKTVNVRLKFVNDWARAAGSPTLPATITIKASLDTSSDGTGLTRVTFDGGATSKAIPTSQWAISDPVPVTIADNAFFWVTTNVVPSSGTNYPSQSVGVANKYATSYASRFDDLIVVNSATDYTMTVPASWPANSAPDPFATPANGTAWGPFAVYGEVARGATRQKSLVVLGDSLSVGFSDDTSLPEEAPHYTYVGYAGWHGRSLEGFVPYVHVGYAGGTLAAFNTKGYTEYREARTSGADNALVNLGVNDAASLSTAQIKTHLTNLVSDLAGIYETVYVSRFVPLASSTDSYATTTNQTVTAGGVKLAAVNTWLDTNPFGLSNVRVIDLWKHVRATKSNGDIVWRAGYTSDGTHPGPIGHVAAAKVVRSLFME